MLERASVEEETAERQRLLTFVVVGAGYAGIEIGAEANNLLRSAIRFYPNLRPEELQVSILTDADRILPAMREQLADKAARHLSKKGVRLRLKTGVVSASAGELALSNGERVQTRTVIVTAGIVPNPVVLSLPVEKDRGRLKTDAFCRIPSVPGVYAVGDNASVPHFKTGDACPATFLYAVTQGNRAADNIVAEVRRRPLRAYTFHSFTEIAQLGITFGLVQIGGMAFSGLLASLLVRAAFFFAIPSWRCRLGLLADSISELALPPDLSQMKIARTDLIVPLRFAAGQEIIREGEPGTRFYIINSGRVEVVRGAGAQAQVLAVLGPGQYFGEIALLHGSDRTATVRAVEDTTVLGIARKDFTALVRSLPVLEQAMTAVTRNSRSLAAEGERRNTV
jgi:NADH:quinone reductase (non-electrogenic)